MGYALLWIENLVFWSCFCAFGTAVASRIERRSIRWLVLLAFLSVPIIFLGSLATLTGFLELGNGLRMNLFIPSVCLLALTVVVGAILCVRGLRAGPDDQRRAARWELRTLALTTVGALLVHTMTFWNLDLAVRQQMDSLRIEAGALAMSVAPPPIPDRENAALLYQQAFDGGLLRAKPANYERWLNETGRWHRAEDDPPANDAKAAQPRAPFDPKQDAEFRAYVEQNSALCRLLREAAAKPSCNFARDWSRPSFAMVIQETQEMRGAARELQLEAHYLAPSMLPLAFADLVAMHRIADHVGQEPLLVSLLVSYAIESMAVRNLEQLLQEYPVSGADLDVLDAWRPIPAIPRMQRALRMEEAFGISTMCQIADWRDFDSEAEMLGMRGWPPNASPLYRVFMLRDDVAYYQEMFRQTRDAGRLPLLEQKKKFEKINDSVSTTPGGIVSRLLAPAIDLAFNAAHRADAHQRLAQLAIVAHRYRLAKGDFPESIDELVKDSKTIYAHDPFSTDLLKMTRRDGDVILYSVGPDLEDNDGQAQTAKAVKFDLTFVLKTPPKGPATQTTK